MRLVDDSAHVASTNKYVNRRRVHSGCPKVRNPKTGNVPVKRIIVCYFQFEKTFSLCRQAQVGRSDATWRIADQVIKLRNTAQVSVLVVRQSLILGSAVLALATVRLEKTGANAQTADRRNPNF